jgi:LmbE family N-acetylglucosaminyl deacetylase
MDDEALACGGLIAQLPQKEQIHLIYATDGMKSPAPVMPGDTIDRDLGEVRVRESITAMGLLGVPEKNLHFLRLPEGQLSSHITKLRENLLNNILNINADTILIPFRYDRHLDHLKINQIVVEAHQQDLVQSQIIEYFVYYRSRLLPLRDIRKYIHSNFLITVNIEGVAADKRRALDCFISQTTLFYPWQTRPILTASLLDEECQNPEYFLYYHPAFPGTAVFKKLALWIRIAHRIEPYLQKWKYLSGALFKRLVRT